MKKVIFLLLLTSLLASASCGGEAPADTTEAPPVSDSVTEEAAKAYPYPTKEFGDYEFTFLNWDECNWANRLLVPEETNGELVNDAMFNRNARVEEALGIKLTERVDTKERLPELIKAAVNSDDAIYDVTMCPVDNAGALLLDGYFEDLRGISTMHLEDSWWDQTVIESATIENSCYFATSDITLFPFEATWVIYFNKNKMDKLQLEYPYELVREGKWTFDELTRYSKEAANLNGQDSFKYDQENGKADYGIVAHSQFPEASVLAFGETYLNTDEDIPTFTGMTDRLMTAYEKFAALTSSEGAFIDRGIAGFTGGEDRMTVEFKKDRFMFMAETLGHMASLRDNNSDFGILPMPKLDVNQENYISPIASWGTLMTTVPKSCSDTERAGMVLDMLAYESSLSLIEPYYNTYLTQKGVRDEDSAEMLQIVRSTRCVAITKMFGWTTTLFNTVNSALLTGDSALASTLASAEESINAAIEATYELLQ